MDKACFALPAITLPNEAGLLKTGCEAVFEIPSSSRCFLSTDCLALGSQQHIFWRSESNPLNDDEITK